MTTPTGPDSEYTPDGPDAAQTPGEVALEEHVEWLVDRVLRPEARHWIVDPADPSARSVITETARFATKHSGDSVSIDDIFQPPLTSDMEALLERRRSQANEQFGCAALCDERFSRYIRSTSPQNRNYREPETGRTVDVGVNTYAPHTGVTVRIADIEGKLLASVNAHFDWDIRDEGGVRDAEWTMDHVVVVRRPELYEEVMPSLPEGAIFDGVDQAMVTRYIHRYLADTVKQVIAGQSETKELMTEEYGAIPLENAATQVDVIGLFDKLPQVVAAQLRSEL